MQIARFRLVNFTFVKMLRFFKIPRVIVLKLKRHIKDLIFHRLFADDLSVNLEITNPARAH